MPAAGRAFSRLKSTRSIAEENRQAGRRTANSVCGHSLRVVQKKSTPCRKPRNSGGSPSGVNAPPMFETRKMKNTTTWALKRRPLIGANKRPDQDHRGAGRPNEAGDHGAEAEDRRVDGGEPLSVPLITMPPAAVNSASSMRMKGRYSSAMLWTRAAAADIEALDGDKAGQSEKGPERGGLLVMDMPPFLDEERPERDRQQHADEGQAERPGQPRAVEALRRGGGRACDEKNGERYERAARQAPRTRGSAPQVDHTPPNFGRRRRAKVARRQAQVRGSITCGGSRRQAFPLAARSIQGEHRALRVEGVHDEAARHLHRAIEDLAAGRLHSVGARHRSPATLK